MPWIDRLQLLGRILDDGAVPTFVAADPETAFDVVRACRDGGSRVVEFTNRGDFAHATFGALARRVDAELPEVALGAGTITDAPTAALFIASGARFIVGQSFDEGVARLCNRHRIAYIPGCGSATEIAAAEELGCEILKLFPAAAFDGPAFIRGIHGPAPHSRIMPTNVEATEAATRRWIASGAAALGVGPHLLSPALIVSRDVPAMATRVAEFLGWVRAARTTGAANG
jgi:2-dehydro-3-deoxyphosphogluconate aldolase/(4S)-4-hydroxy-2-oxoglutarate aldolase